MGNYFLDIYSIVISYCKLGQDFLDIQNIFNKFNVNVKRKFQEVLTHTTVCPGSSDPQEKIFQHICIRN